MSPLGASRPPRRTRRGDAAGGSSRFRRGQRPREEYASKLIQSITLSVLCVALIWLLGTSLRLIRAHFVEKTGAQAWLLPLSIGLILLFLLYRLFKLWAELRGLRGELNRSHKSLDDNDID